MSGTLFGHGPPVNFLKLFVSGGNEDISCGSEGGCEISGGKEKVNHVDLTSFLHQIS